MILRQTTTATGPVCLAIVDEDDAKFTSKYREQEYYFCCDWRKKKFEENPKRYTCIVTGACVDPGSCTRTATGGPPTPHFL